MNMKNFNRFLFLLTGALIFVLARLVWFFLSVIIQHKG